MVGALPNADNQPVTCQSTRGIWSNVTFWLTQNPIRINITTNSILSFKHSNSIGSVIISEVFANVFDSESSKKRVEHGIQQRATKGKMAGIRLILENETDYTKRWFRFVPSPLLSQYAVISRFLRLFGQ